VSQRTHPLAYWTEADRGPDATHAALETVVSLFETELDKYFLGWLVDYRVYVMHGLLVFKCTMRLRGRSAIIEESIPVELALHLGGLSVSAATAEHRLAFLPKRCLERLAERRTDECQA